MPPLAGVVQRGVYCTGLWRMILVRSSLFPRLMTTAWHGISWNLSQWGPGRASRLSFLRRCVLRIHARASARFSYLEQVSTPCVPSAWQGQGLVINDTWWETAPPTSWVSLKVQLHLPC